MESVFDGDDDLTFFILFPIWSQKAQNKELWHLEFELH